MSVKLHDSKAEHSEISSLLGQGHLVDMLLWILKHLRTGPIYPYNRGYFLATWYFVYACIVLLILSDLLLLKLASRSFLGTWSSQPSPIFLLVAHLCWLCCDLFYRLPGPPEFQGV